MRFTLPAPVPRRLSWEQASIRTSVGTCRTGITRRAGRATRTRLGANWSPGSRNPWPRPSLRPGRSARTCLVRSPGVPAEPAAPPEAGGGTRPRGRRSLTGPAGRRASAATVLAARKGFTARTGPVAPAVIAARTGAAVLTGAVPTGAATPTVSALPTRHRMRAPRAVHPGRTGREARAPLAAPGDRPGPGKAPDPAELTGPREDRAGKRAAPRQCAGSTTRAPAGRSGRTGGRVRTSRT